MATTEHTINDALAELLRQTRFAWRDENVVLSETTQLLAESGGLRPDIAIKEPFTAAVVIETEILPAQTVEEETLSRLGKELKRLGEIIHSAIALRLPQRLTEASGLKLKDELAITKDFEFALYSGENADKCDRYPQSGWLSGGITDLSLLVQSASTPPLLIEKAADAFEEGVNQAAGYLNDIARRHPAAVQRIAEELHQQDSTQTRRMAMVILVNAFIFHEHLAGGHDELGEVRTLSELEFGETGLQIPAILEDWNIILQVNYWPIFDIACRILRAIPSFRNNEFIKRLARTAEALVSNGLMRSHDLTGTVFQKLISDRKFLAAFYTTPASAALLVGLAVNEDTLLSRDDWSIPDAVKSLRIADFACGTGTLLSTAYQRISQIHELHGGNAEAIHPQMLARALVGCDILPAAAHLTAAMLASAYPHVQYDESAIFTAPYGVQADGIVKLGSIDLLRDMALLQGSEITAKAIEATKGAEVDIWRYAPHRSFDMVIMNPPFPRPTNHEGDHANVPNPVFAAFGSSSEDQEAMTKQAKQLTKRTIYHGNAGEASAFMELADRKLKIDGVLALVMPLTLLTGSSWERSRNRLASAYENLMLITIAGVDNAPLSFSADTNMGECLVIGHRTGRPSQRATFVILEEKPANSIYGTTVARQIRQLIEHRELRKLEGVPNGGSDIQFGDSTLGQAIDAPLPNSGSWKLARVFDLSLAQSAYHLATKSRVWLPSQRKHIDIHIALVRQIGEIGPIGRDINGKNPDGSIRGPFELRQIRSDGVPTYPVLWAHSAKRERIMVFEADCEGIPRPVHSPAAQSVINDKAFLVFETASHCHHNVDFRFNSQSTAMQFTKRKTIGGRAWISIQLPTAELEKALVLWANSSLGLLMYWWHSSKQQPGRGSIPKLALQTLPILDVTTLNPDQLERAVQLFNETNQLPLKPLHELDKDENRKTLDRRFYGEVLGFPNSILADGGPLDILRQKLCREPSIRGSKK